MALQNPFKPTAGAVPPVLIGRDDVLDEFQESIEDGPGAPARLATFTGPRGIGKTVLLAKAVSKVRDSGWLAITETATPGLTERLSLTVRAELTARGVGGAPDETSPEWTLRRNLNALLDQLESQGVGLLVAVDEVHRAARDDLRAVTTIFQHLTGDRRNVAMILAGLPSALSDLLNDKILTFLRRATPFVLADVPLPAVRQAFLDAITAGGKEITDDALDEITSATSGYPFMIQLVGYHVWRKSKSDRIGDEAAAEGVSAARKRLGSTVHASAFDDLSPVDRTVLIAMAQDDGPSKTSDIAARLGVEQNYVSVYRRRMIAAGVIEATSYGYVDFAIPYLRDYLRDHVSHEQFNVAQRELLERESDQLSHDNHSDGERRDDAS